MIEAARNRSGQEPADAFMKKLFSSRRKRRSLDDLVILMEEWAQYGELQVPLQQRQLRGDLWEIKTSELRFPYYELADAEHGRIVRLTHGFEKDFGRTVDAKCPRKHIDMGLWMIEEDRTC